MLCKLSKYCMVVFILSLFLITCKGKTMSENTQQSSNIESIADTLWEKLGEKKIYFGHQSVGDNILAGISELLTEYPSIQLEIVETDDAADFDRAIFAHSKIGKNGAPQSKIDAFANIVEKGVGQKADIAFFKFCYVDFHDNIDVEEVFSQYKETFSFLREQFPEIQWVHSTVPLTSQQTGPKAWIKKIAGKPLRGYTDNIKRNQFNQRLKAEFDGKEPVFDLATAESTFPDGERASFTEEGKSYYSMVSDYTDDGAHLNQTGRKIIAEQFLLFMATLPE